MGLAYRRRPGLKWPLSDRERMSISNGAATRAAGEVLPGPTEVGECHPPESLSS